MSLWEQYQKDHADDALIEDVPASMLDATRDWLHEMCGYVQRPYEFAMELKNRFRINDTIPTSYRNSYSDPSDSWKLASFLLNLTQTNSTMFFVILDYMLSKGLIPDGYVVRLAHILENAGHMYTVQKNGGKYSISERIPQADLEFMGAALEGKNIYASEFRDAFAEMYGPKPNHTAAAGEAFQALESALKYYFGDDKGNNLGALLDWLRKNKDSWEYTVPSDSQTDAQDHVLALVDFVNKSFRKTKHGHADKKLTVHKEHAETVIRTVALLIYELEHTVRIITK